MQFAVQPPTQDPLQGVGSVVGNLLFPLLFLGGLFLLNRRGGMGGPGGPMGMLQPKSKIQMEPQTGVTFADVAGCDGSKLELTEVVDFLKEPAKYSALGAKIPKGAVMEGPPGTGKTLLARAVANRTDACFIRVIGSELVQKYVGEGARMVRELFQMA